MTKLSKLFHKRLHMGSIFRKRKDGHTHKIKQAAVNECPEEDETVNLEASYSTLTVIDDSFSSSLEDHITGTKSLQDVKIKTLVEKPKKKKNVSFSNVTVRHYDLILGDNPGCKYPLALGWCYRREESHEVDHFEERREERESQFLQDRIEPRLYLPRKYPNHYLSDVHVEQDYDDLDGSPIELSLYERRARLRAFGYTEAGLRQAERQRLTALALEWNHDVDRSVPFPFSPNFIARYAK